MKSCIINQTSPLVDIQTILSGVWNEWDDTGWHIVRTPFFLVLTLTADAGKLVLPYTFDRPVAGLLMAADGDVKALVVKPRQNVIEVEKPGIVRFELFGIDTQGIKGV